MNKPATLASQLGEVEINRIVELINKLIRINEEQSKVIEEMNNAKGSFIQVADQIRSISTCTSDEGKKNAIINFSSSIKKVIGDIDTAIDFKDDNDKLKEIADFISFYYQSNFEVEVGAAIEEARNKRNLGL